MNGPLNRRSINVSTYLQNLNTLHSADEQKIDPFNPDDLDIWTNTQFYDFDMGQIAEAPAIQPTKDHRQTISALDPSLQNGVEFDHFLNELKELDNYECSPVFVDYTKTESQPIPEIQLEFSPSGSRGTSQSPTVVAPPAAYTLSNASSPVSVIQSVNGTGIAGILKRKASSTFDEPPRIPESLNDASRLAAEEDKRRRNTAASARFRVKKKQKEQQLEKTAKEMTDRVTQLEQENLQLKMENKWLKNLIVEKNGGKSGEEMHLPPPIHTSSKDGIGITGDRTLKN